MQLRHRRRNKGKQEPHLNSEGEISLTDLQEGTKGIVTHTTGELGVVRRLSDMGLTPGSEVKLLRKCSFRGPIEIEVRGVALALGYGLASEIFVQRLKANSND
jgi:Fe2+ transport system protein FeoA